jgi:hypothetical protein
VRPDLLDDSFELRGRGRLHVHERVRFARHRVGLGHTLQPRQHLADIGGVRAAAARQLDKGLGVRAKGFVIERRSKAPDHALAHEPVDPPFYRGSGQTDPLPDGTERCAPIFDEHCNNLAVEIVTKQEIAPRKQ